MTTTITVAPARSAVANRRKRRGRRQPDAGGGGNDDDGGPGNMPTTGNDSPQLNTRIHWPGLVASGVLHESQ